MRIGFDPGVIRVTPGARGRSADLVHLHDEPQRFVGRDLRRRALGGVGQRRRDAEQSLPADAHAGNAARVHPGITPFNGNRCGPPSIFEESNTLPVEHATPT